MQTKSIQAYSDFLKKQGIPLPTVHVVLGSGFGTALDSFPWKMAGELSFSEIPGMPNSTVQDHAGRYRFYTNKNLTISFQMGRLHGYEGHEPADVVQTVMIPRLAGVQNFLLTNASGGLSLSYKPGDVLLIRDQVNLTGKNPLIGKNPSYNGKELGPRFPDMANLYNKKWRESLSKHCKAKGLGVHEGVYMGTLGPSFETHAEVELYARWGMHAVGMSTVWEAIALRHSGAKLAGLSLISNLGAGMTNESLDHGVILETCRSSASRIVSAILCSVEEEFS